MITGLVGEKLGHSFSREIHSALGDTSYRNFELKKDELAEFISKREFDGINVTIPYKTDVIPLLDSISDEAKAIGAVNTVVNRGGKLSGYNTDFFGMRELIIKNGIPVKGNAVLILGTGGTSRTAKAVAENLGALSIEKVSRHPKGDEISYATAKEKYSSSPVVIINTTPLGMFPNIFGCAIEPKDFSCLLGAVDVVFNPLKTELIVKAEMQGVPSCGGLYMLVTQAVKASELFFDKKYPEGSTEKIYRGLLAKKENIVLIGMPSCGKTTIGKIIAERTGKSFIDCDALFESTFGISPADCINGEGEDAFRDKESLVIRDIAAKNSCVIATGGGAILKEENVINLKKNGNVIFIDRSPEKLTATSDRPLSQSRELIEKRYRERYGIYCSASDIKVDGNGSAADVANMILSKEQK